MKVSEFTAEIKGNEILNKKNISVVTLPKNSLYLAKKIISILENTTIFIVKDISKIKKQLDKKYKILPKSYKQKYKYLKPDYTIRYSTDTAIYNNVLIDTYFNTMVFVQENNIEYVSN